LQVVETTEWRRRAEDGERRRLLLKEAKAEQSVYCLITEAPKYRISSKHLTSIISLVLWAHNLPVFYSNNKILLGRK